MNSKKMYFLEIHLINLFMGSVKTHSVGVAGFEPAASCSQSRRDNRATLHPELLFGKAERLGLEPRRRLPVDRLAICSVTTPAPLLLIFFLNVHSKNADANVPFHPIDRNYFSIFLNQ